ncbi:MAG: hypothetical protein AVDCRST_MAG73-1658, partial [uncultured Thermomicrobiales bacterium]
WAEEDPRPIVVPRQRVRRRRERGYRLRHQRFVWAKNSTMALRITAASSSSQPLSTVRRLGASKSTG